MARRKPSSISRKQEKLPNGNDTYLEETPMIVNGLEIKVAVRRLTMKEPPAFMAPFIVTERKSASGEMIHGADLAISS